MLSPHPLAELFPPMDDETFKVLVADIRANGLRDPILLWESQILDGRNRYRACSEIGITPITRNWDGPGDPLDFVISKNLVRRHLSESQRADVAAKITNMKKGGDRRSENFKGPIGPLKSDQDASQPEPPLIGIKRAAEMMNVSERSVKRAKVVLDAGVPELQKAVEAGRVSLTAAEQIARRPKEEQREIMSKGPAAVAQAANEIRSTRPKTPASKKDANAKRSETLKLKAELYRQLRDAVELLCGLPDPSEVADIVAGISSARPLMDARLPQALTWLERFSDVYSNRRQDSSAA